MKKENIIIIVLIILVGGFVFFLPTIENKFSGRKVEIHNDDSDQDIKQPTEYTCTSTSESSLASVSRKIVFSLDNKGNVTKIDTTTITAYNNKEEYQTNKKAASALKDVGITYNISMDDKNNMLTIQSIQDISKNNTTTYPLEHTELENYLAQNNYICTIK